MLQLVPLVMPGLYSRYSHPVFHIPYGGSHTTATQAGQHVPDTAWSTTSPAAACLVLELLISEHRGGLGTVNNHCLRCLHSL